MNNIFAIVGIGPNRVEIPLLVFENEEAARIYLEQFELDKLNESLYDIPEEMGEVMKKAFFKNGRYYGGCGECYRFEIRPVEFGKPMGCWNLD